MATYLFTSQPAMGHLNPLLAIAAELAARGHVGVFACPQAARVERAVAGKGYRLIALPSPVSAVGLALLPYTSGFAETTLAMISFFSGLEFYARALAPALDEVKPDAIVSDFAFPGAMLAADVRGIPHAVVYSAGLAFAGPGIPPFGSGLAIGRDSGLRGRCLGVIAGWTEARARRKVARARTRLGLPPVDLAGAAYLCSPWLTLVLTAEACEAPRSGLPGSVFFIGPCYAGRQAEQADSFPYDRLDADRPKVYVSLGTVFNDKPKVFQRIIDAFADGRCQVVLSAGGAYAALQARALPAHVLLFPRVPQVGLLPRVDAVVSHGGNNTVNETLAAGKPLLVMPVGGEQGDNAARVEYLGAGLRAGLTSAPSAEIGAKVRRLIEEPSFRRRAGEIAAQLARTAGTVTAARFVERLAQARRPILRPAGHALTVTTDLSPPWER